MWQKITSCGKQLKGGDKVRQLINDTDNYTVEYLLKEIDIDNYELQITAKQKDDFPVEIDLAEALVLDCDYLLNNNFEVWTD